MYAIKQIKICAEYRDMLPRPRLDLSGTPGFRPIGFSPGSWQNSLGLGSMSRYSAQILICILDFAYDLLIFLILAPFWLSETRQIWVIVIFFRTHGRNGLKFECWCILTIFATDYIWVMGCWFPLSVPLWLTETGQIVGFLRTQGRNVLE